MERQAFRAFQAKKKTALAVFWRGDLIKLNKRLEGQFVRDPR